MKVFKPSTWNKIEDVYLAENSFKFTLKELSEILGKSLPVISRRLHSLGIGKRKASGKLFTCLNPICGIKFYRSPSDEKKSKSGRHWCSNSCHSINRKLSNLPTKKEIEKDYSDKLSTNDLSKKYKISKGSVYNLFILYGLKGRNAKNALETFYQTEKGQETIDKRLSTIDKKYGTRVLSKSGFFKGGFRKDLGVGVRSEWEAVVLRWLNKKKIKWEYEPKRFDFNEIKRGTRSYLPDIYLPNLDIWIEIKGYLSKKDKTKIKRFKKYYPSEFSRLQVIVRKNGPTFKFFEEINVPTYKFYNDIEKEIKDS